MSGSKSSVAVALLFVGIHASHSSAAEEFRTWTSAQGTELVARLVRIDPGSVTLENEEGRRFSIRREALGAEDKNFIQAQAEARASMRDEAGEAARQRVLSRVQQKEKERLARQESKKYPPQPRMWTDEKGGLHVYNPATHSGWFVSQPKYIPSMKEQMVRGRVQEIAGWSRKPTLETRTEAEDRVANAIADIEKAMAKSDLMGDPIMRRTTCRAIERVAEDAGKLGLDETKAKLQTAKHHLERGVGHTEALSAIREAVRGPR